MLKQTLVLKQKAFSCGSSPMASDAPRASFHGASAVTRASMVHDHAHHGFTVPCPAYGSGLMPVFSFIKGVSRGHRTVKAGTS